MWTLSKYVHVLQQLIEDTLSFVEMCLCIACCTRLGESLNYANGSCGNMDGLSEELDVPGRNICFNGSAKVGRLYCPSQLCWPLVSFYATQLISNTYIMKLSVLLCP